MSDSVQPHRRQPTRLPCSWDSPGKNTGVGCHFLLQCMKVKSEREVSQSCLTQRPHGLQPIRLLHPWDFPGKSTGVGCHCLLQGRGEYIVNIMPGQVIRLGEVFAAAKLLQSSPTLRPHRQQPTRLPCPWDSPGRISGMGCHFLLQCMKMKSEK